MILSMTGFGTGRARKAEEEVSVEIRSVNHKFCEVKTRIPQELAALEFDLVKQIKASVRRGAIDVSIKRVGVGKSTFSYQVDLQMAREYVSVMNRVAEELGLENNLGIAELAQIEGIVLLEPKSIDWENLSGALQNATMQALQILRAMREREGAALAKDISGRIGMLRQYAYQVSELSSKSVERCRARIEEKLAELGQSITVDAQRLAQEILFFADRVDITEELTRFDSHLDAFQKLVEEDEPAGRRMDFLVQELNRETNTMGSKSQHAEIAHLIVAMKSEIERIREQVQNVE